MEITKKELVDAFNILKIARGGEDVVYFDNTGTFTHTEYLSIFNKNLILTNDPTGYSICLSDFEKAIKKLRNKKIKLDFTSECCIIEDNKATYSFKYENSNIKSYKMQNITEVNSKELSIDFLSGLEHCICKIYHNQLNGVFVHDNTILSISIASGMQYKLENKIDNTLLFPAKTMELLQKCKQVFDKYTILYAQEDPVRFVLSNATYVMSCALAFIPGDAIQDKEYIVRTFFGDNRSILFDIPTPDGLKASIESASLFTAQSKDDLENRINIIFNHLGITVSCKGKKGEFIEVIEWEDSPYLGTEVSLTFATSKIKEVFTNKSERISLCKVWDEEGNNCDVLYVIEGNGCRYIMGMEG